MKKRKVFYSQMKKARRSIAFALSLAMIGSLVPTGFAPIRQEVKAETVGIVEDFESDSYLGEASGALNVSIEKDAENAHGGNGALFVSGRKDEEAAYSYNVESLAGKKVKLDAFLKIASDTLKAVALVEYVDADDEEDYELVALADAQNGKWVQLSQEFQMPTGAKKLFFATYDVKNQLTLDDYYLDDVTIGEPKEVTELKMIEENFDTYQDASERIGSSFGNPTFSLSGNGVDGTKALLVSDREQNYFGYAYNLNNCIGNTIKLTAKIAAYEAAEVENALSATIKLTREGKDDDYKCVSSVTATGSDFVTLEGTFEIPSDCTKAEMYFEAPKDVSYLLDDVCVFIEGEYADPTKKPSYVDISDYAVLKDLYRDYFKMGVASEALSHWGGANPLNEIGNPYKEALIKKEFNSLTFGNELKPDYNMGWNSEEATETDLPFVIDTSAKEMLDWAKENGIKVRGHVLVWHSQCADNIFCKGYKPVYKDENKKVLDPECFASKEVMLQRLESYINHVMEYMYANGYGDTIYAWDVVNESVEPGTNVYNLRDSYWYKTMGVDFMYYSFKYAREASVKYAKQYAALYGVDENDAYIIQPKLFYNDYNEYQKVKCDAIIDILTKTYNGHNIKEEDLIDGVGMQSHVSDNTKLEDYMTALRRYDEAIGEVHITELDVAQTSSGVNAEYYQAIFYNEFFKALIDEVKNGVNLTSVTIWGLTDDNSWKKESSPLVFNADLSKKMAFDGIVNAITGEPMPEPAYEAPDFTDTDAGFEDGTVEGFGTRGDGNLTVQSDVVLDGKYALKVSGRTATWNGVSFDVSRFIGQTVEISAWVKSAANQVKLSADIDQVWPNIATVSTKSGEWVQIRGKYTVPSELTSLKLYFEADDLSDIYIDGVKVKLTGLEEGFEGKTSIAKARGVGHMPTVTVTGEESRSEGGHSLKVIRSEKDATVSLDVSKYIGRTVNVKAYVKTSDSKVTLGLDGDSPVIIAEEDTVAGGWTEVAGMVTIPDNVTSANMYIETDGTADFYVDDFSVTLADFVDNVEGSHKFTTRWGGAGELSVVEEDNGNHAVKLTDRAAGYYGVVFDVTPYLGMEVEISVDVKTDDKTISLSGDIDQVWPNYARVASKPGAYTTVKAVVKLPKDLSSLRLYIETDGTSDLYVDNLTIRRVQVKKEYKVTFDGNGVEKANSVCAVAENDTVKEPVLEEDIAGRLTGWYKDKALTQKWNFAEDTITEDVVLYAKWQEAEPSPSPSVKPSPSPAAKKEYTVNLSVTKPSSLVAKATVLKKYLSKGQNVKYVIKDKKKKVAYVWTFNAKNYNKKIKLKNINLIVKTSAATKLKYSNGLILDLKQQGKLPMQASLKVKVSSKFKAGKTAYLYSVDSKRKTLYSVPNNKYKVDKSGYVTLALATSTDYVLLPTAKPKVKTVSVLAQVKTTKSVTMKKGSKKSVVAKLPATLVKVSSLKKFNKTLNKAVYGAVVTYKTSKSSIATVSKDGKVTAKKKGKAVITITVSLSNKTKKTYKTTITVK